MRALLLMIAVLPLAACQSNWERSQGNIVPSSGKGETREFAASGFTAVSLGGSDDVDVKIADNFSVRAEGDPKILDLLEIRVDGNTLRIGRKDQHGTWFHSDHGARIHVTMPKLTAAAVAGSGTLTVDRAEGDFSGSIAGSGDLSVAQLTGGDTNLSIAGSGDLKIAGTTNSLKVGIAGAGDIDAVGLKASSANISIAGSGDVAGTVAGEANVSIIGSGDVVLKGGARCKVSAMGSGEARCS